MLNTAKLTAAVETLRAYCEQVRLAMNARGYAGAEIHLTVRSGCPGYYGPGSIGAYDDGQMGDGIFQHFALTEFEKALAYAEARPRRATEADIAATLGITPDGRVLEVVEG
ncbi:MAG TPA: hypothetical protein VF226_01685 [Hyphomicrobiaceae bacterium]